MLKPILRRRWALRLTVVLGVAAGAATAALLAFSFFSGTTPAAANTVSAAVIGQGATPAPVTTDGTTVTITVPTIMVGTNEIPTYHVTRYKSDLSTSAPISGSCTMPSGGTVTCTDVPGGGQWKYTDTPYYNDWVGTESGTSATVITDTTPPTSAITFPAAGGAYNNSGWANGCLGTICGTANDPGAGASGVHDVKISIKGPGNTYWNGTDFTSGTEVKFAVTGTSAWSYTFPAANFATTGGGAGAYTVTSYATDNAANVQSPGAAAAFVLDNTAPTATPTVTGTLGSNGWYTSDVQVSWATSDTGSGVASTSGCSTANVTSDTNGTTFTCSATDNAGNSSSQSVTIKRDATPPTVSTPTVTGTLGSNGWYTSNVQVSWATPTDPTSPGSGIASTSGCSTSNVTADTNGTVFTCSATDNAGNIASQTVTIKRDATLPADAISLAASPAPVGAFMSGNTVYFNNNSPGSVTFVNTVTDATSGPASAHFPGLGQWSSCAAHDISSPAGGPYSDNLCSWSAGDGTPVSHTYTSTDNAGNTSSGASIAFVNDPTAPIGGAFTANSVSATTGGATTFATGTSISWGARTNYTDAGSGLKSSVLTVASAALTSNTCGTYGTPATLTGSSGTQTVSADNCYLFTLTGTDNVGNVASIGVTVVVTGTASKLGFTTQPGGGVVSTAWSQQPVVAIQDAAGNTVPTAANTAITLTHSAGSGSFSCTPSSNSVTTSAGVATFAGCQISVAGTNHVLTAAGSSVSSAVSNAFTIFPVPSVTEVATGFAGGSTVSSGSFTPVSGATYLILSAHTSATGDSAILTSGAWSSSTLVAQQTLTDNISYQWAWIATATTNTASTATVAFGKATTKTASDNVVEVLLLSNANAMSPILGTRLTAAAIAGKQLVANLPTLPTGGSYAVFVYSSGDTGGPDPGGPSWNVGTGFSSLTSTYGHSGGPDSGFGADVGVSTTSGSSATYGNSSFPAGADAYGTIAFGLNPQSATPTVTGVSPVAGTSGGGTSVTITGTNLTGATAVKFGSTNAASYTVNNSTQITATSPAGSLGTVDVTVTTPIGTSPTSTADQYTFDVPPTVTGVNPAAVSTAGGTTVTLSGTGFLSATGVTFGSGHPGTIGTITSDTLMTVVAPAESAGTVDVQVTTPLGTSPVNSPADQVTFGTPPTVTGLSSPSYGPLAGGNSITVSGTNLGGASAVEFGLTAGTITSDTSSSITATVPTGSAGPVDVIVVTAFGTSATSSADVYTYETTPSVTAISPTTGGTAGGTSVTVTGTGFLSESGVTFGGVAGTGVHIISDTSLTVSSPAHAGAGTVHVQVSNGAGTSATSAADQFTYSNGLTYIATGGPTTWTNCTMASPCSAANVNYPNGTQPGDLVILVIEGNTEPGPPTLNSSGWTSAPGDLGGGGGGAAGQHVAVYYRIAGSETSASVTPWAPDTGHSSYVASDAAWVIRYEQPSGTPTASGAVVDGYQKTPASSLAPTTTKPSAGGTTEITIAMQPTSTALTLTSPASFTLENSTTSAVSGDSLAIADQFFATGPSSAPTAPTWTGANSYWAWWTLAFT